MTKCLTTCKIEYIFKQGTAAISLLHLQTRSNHLVFTFTSTDLVADALNVRTMVTRDTSDEPASLTCSESDGPEVADALKVENMVTRDTSKEHANLTCSESDGSEVADALNGFWEDSNRDSSEVHASLTSSESDG
jgi:hypothetical protein